MVLTITFIQVLRVSTMFNDKTTIVDDININLIVKGDSSMISQGIMSR